MGLHKNMGKDLATAGILFMLVCTLPVGHVYVDGFKTDAVNADVAKADDCVYADELLEQNNTLDGWVTNEDGTRS